LRGRDHENHVSQNLASGGNRHRAQTSNPGETYCSGESYNDAEKACACNTEALIFIRYATWRKAGV
jgi:hypothetical protein